MNKITNTHKSYKRNILVFQLVLIHYLVTRYSLLVQTQQTKHHISLVSQLQIENKYKISTTSINNIYRTNKKG